MIIYKCSRCSILYLELGPNETVCKVIRYEWNSRNSCGGKISLIGQIEIVTEDGD